MWKLYRNHELNWLHIESDVTESKHYFLSFCYRFCNLFSVIRQFEREAIFVESRIATERDQKIVKFAEALRWCVTDVDLFDGLDYDPGQCRDHIYADTFRDLLDGYQSGGEGVKRYSEFKESALESGAPEEVLSLFNSLSKSESRFRWDRLVALHLLVVLFVNTIGYEEQKTSQKRVLDIASQLVNNSVLEALIEWLPRMGLPDEANSLSTCSARMRGVA